MLSWEKMLAKHNKREFTEIIEYDILSKTKEMLVWWKWRRMDALPDRRMIGVRDCENQSYNWVKQNRSYYDENEEEWMFGRKKRWFVEKHGSWNKKKNRKLCEESKEEDDMK